MKTAETPSTKGKGVRLTPETEMDTITLEDMRELIFEASGKIERLARLAVESVGCDGFDDVLPQLMERLLNCNSAILSASGGDSLTLGEGYEAIFGRFGPGFAALFGTEGA